MALQDSGQITWANIVTEMGTTSGDDYLSEYYRKGRGTKPVPDNDKNDAIPTSGQIAYSNYYSGYGAFSTNHTVVLSFTTGKLAGADDIASPSTMWTGAGGVEVVILGEASATTQLFLVYVNGNRAKSYFGSILMGGVTMTTSSSNHSYDGGTGKTLWQWTGAQSPALASGTHSMWMYE
jgi:hypothetical protein